MSTDDLAERLAAEEPGRRELFERVHGLRLAGWSLERIARRLRLGNWRRAHEVWVAGATPEHVAELAAADQQQPKGGDG